MTPKPQKARRGEREGKKNMGIFDAKETNVITANVEDRRYGFVAFPNPNFIRSAAQVYLIMLGMIFGIIIMLAIAAFITYKNGIYAILMSIVMMSIFSIFAGPLLYNTWSNIIRVLLHPIKFCTNDVTFHFERL